MQGGKVRTNLRVADSEDACLVLYSGARTNWKIPMSPLAGRPFLKMNGAGNEIVVLDLRGAGIAMSAAEARAIASGEGLAYDQMMALFDPRTPDTEAFVRIYNSDGSEAGACGNGTRCVAWSLMRGDARDEIFIETIAGKISCRRDDAFSFTVDMGVPRLAWNEIPLRDAIADTRDIPVTREGLSHPSAVSMGNPHAIFFVADIASHDLARLGPLLEHDPMFPERANISLAQIVSRDHINLKVWERSAGLTLACGSAACATVVAAVGRDLADRRARVSLPGGDLVIEWRASDGHVLMSGPVELEFEGRFDPSLFAGLAA